MQAPNNRLKRVSVMAVCGTMTSGVYIVWQFIITFSIFDILEYYLYNELDLLMKGMNNV